ncbi:hypothetical protein AYI70_g2423 [Smittium culicis]|uniref:Flavin-nucleotide-binding protein n=1 Tax=Smittium culicis TaxID=133412 RepID=A0A1R1Y895_9FUNG|nr:hypothetical protein AYI70_g8080 [Smittium culicis]OMJ17067.1 hypothetical protein AYI70_g6208 [Smittium culicis]OMJ23171.1 hypothetical protein AYI70_g2423 [Smittium culicis]
MATYEPKSSDSINFIKRYRERAHYDHETVNKILDAGLIAHVGFKAPKKKNRAESDAEDSDDQYPNVIPMTFSRIDQTLYLHGYISARILKALSGPIKGSASEEQAPKATVTVSIIDGLIVTLSAMNNSSNYRSVCCFGKARLVEDFDEKKRALAQLVNKQFMGGNKWDDSRAVYDSELKRTRVVAIDIETASAKIKSAGPVDDKEDIEDDEVVNKYWAGVVPIKTVYGKPEACSYNRVEVPDYVSNLENKFI